MNNQLLREIPKVDDLLRSPALVSLCPDAPRGALADAVRTVLAELRQAVLEGRAEALPEEAALCTEAAARLKRTQRPSLRRAVNGTGVALHTNLGRACLAEAAAAAVAEVARGYSTLEYDVPTGGRGERYSHVEGLLTALTGAEADAAACFSHGRNFPLLPPSPPSLPLEGFAVLNDTPVACQTRGPTDPQGDRCQRS